MTYETKVAIAKAIVRFMDFFREFFAEFGPYIVTAFACINAALAGIGFFTYEGRSILVLAGLLVGFVLTLAAALFCLVQTVVHAYIYALKKWVSTTIFQLRNING